MKRVYPIIIGSLAIIIVFILWHYSKRNPSDGSASIRVGILRHESTLPFYIADEYGLFEKHGVKAVLVELPPGDHMPALLSDRVDIISPTSFPMLFGVMLEHPKLLYVVFPGAEVDNGPTVYGFIVRKDFSGKGIEDLSNSIVMAINPYTQVNIRTILTSAGIPKTKWPEIRIASREVALAAVQKGNATAVIMDQPALAVALGSNEFRLLESNPRAKHIGSPYWSGAGAAKRTTWVEKNDQFDHLMTAIDEAILQIRSDSLSAHRVLAKRLGLDTAIAEQCGGYYFPTSTEAVPTTGIEGTIKALVDAGLLREPISMEGFFPPNLYGLK